MLLFLCPRFPWPLLSCASVSVNISLVILTEQLMSASSFDFKRIWDWVCVLFFCFFGEKIFLSSYNSTILTCVPRTKKLFLKLIFFAWGISVEIFDRSIFGDILSLMMIMLLMVRNIKEMTFFWNKGYCICDLKITGNCRLVLLKKKFNRLLSPRKNKTYNNTY